MSASTVFRRDDGHIEIKRDGKRIACRDTNGEIWVSGSDAARRALAEDVFLLMDNYSRDAHEFHTRVAELEEEAARGERLSAAATELLNLVAHVVTAEPRPSGITAVCGTRTGRISTRSARRGEMGTPQLWVWIGSLDDKLDVMRYVRATKADILRQPAVLAEHDVLRARAEAAEARVAALEAENDRLRASNAQLMAERERAADLLAQSLGEEG